ncbi:Esterase B1 [Pseudolycoriella hygida]|uniref:carboxylesterase n=1 Tax=Pseudolycoriella hygida TaxID=35572 RepID=A0A9Q0NG86_9DIPT|nr:Esterase B1 [Pseudolycoriella hygida]
MTSAEFLIVNIENGPVRGVRTKTIFESEYYSFRGIPYMKPPLGKLRFRDAENIENWSEPFDATEEGPSYCMTDFMTGLQDGQENSGTINIYTKHLDRKQPVMIWVHGGGYCRGSSRTDLFGPDYLLQNDVVFVSFNYRLGAIGFLSLDDPTLNVPGNVGLKDQVFALQWIQRNIHNFGGDRKRCTVFGESAGGASVHFLTITPKTEGLFQKAIIMSGSAFNRTWSFTSRNKQAQRLAQILGWKGDPQNESEILEFLETIPAFELDNASKQLMSAEEQYGLGIIVPFAPVIEPYETPTCIISKEPIGMAREAWSNSIDVIVMGTSFEGLLRAFVEEEKAYSFLTNPSYFAPLNDLHLQPEDIRATEFGTKIKDLYYGHGSHPSTENQEQYLKFSSDFHFWHGLHRLVLSRTKFSSGNTYLLRFDVDAELNMFKALKKAQKYRGACHADDLFYLFTTNYHAPPAFHSREFQTIQRMVGIFTSFAITGNPNCEQTSNCKIVPCGEFGSQKCFNITENNITEIELPEINRLKVWDSVYDELRVPLY